MADKGWDSSKPWQATRQPQNTPAPPRVVPNNSGNYTRPSPPPVANTGPIQPISPPRPPDINAYLGHDTTYQGQVRNYNKTLADFLANETQQRNRITGDYGSAKHAMDTQKTMDLGNIQQDYASRGLLNSGLFAQANSDYNTDWLAKLAELTKGRDRSLADLLSQETNFRKEQQLALQAAREAAIQRRAAQYGL